MFAHDIIKTSLGFLSMNKSAQESVYNPLPKGTYIRYGYWPKQLVSKLGIPMVLAARMSPYLNWWLDKLDSLQGIDEKILQRLRLCTFTFSSLAKYSSVCKLRLCPWCRARQLVHVKGLLASLQPHHCKAMVIPVSDTLKTPRLQPGAVLTARNVLYSGLTFKLGVIQFYRDLENNNPKPFKEQVEMLGHLLLYDFDLVSQPVLNQWLELVKSLRFYDARRR